MQNEYNLYIDESGSMTKKDLNFPLNKYFTICIILPKNSKKLKTVFKRFISSNLNELKKMDKDKKIFYANGKFKELKGTCLNSEMKKKFIKYFCQNDLFEIYYIYCINKNVKEYFYKNTARAFNYVLKLGLESFTKEKYIKKGGIYLHIDERNVKTNTKATLEEYLNTELVTGNHYQESFVVNYSPSETVYFIQLADVFSNIFYSNLLSKKYSAELKQIITDGYIKKIFKFPL